MSLSIAIILLAVGAGLIACVVLGCTRLILRVALTLGKLAIVVALVLLVAWIIGVWQPPEPVLELIRRVRGPGRPFQRSLMEWLSSLFN